MRKLLYLFLLMFLISCGSEKTAQISSNASKGTASVKITTQSIISGLDNAKYRQGEVLVKFKSGVVTSSSLRAHQSIGASVIKKVHGLKNLDLIKLPKEMSVKDAIIHYMSDPNVEYAQPNYIKKLHTVPQAIPNDTFFANQWALNNTGQYANGTAGADIHAPEAWTITSGDQRVVIAVVDSGVDYNHPDLAGNTWKNPDEICGNGIDDDGNELIDDCSGWNFFSDNNTPLDDLGHGTHVAGILGAVGNNALGIAGVAWHVRIMPLKFIGFHEDLNDCGDGTHFCGDTADEVAAIDYAIKKGANIINASFGGNDFDLSEKEKIEEADSQGILLVASAGNDGSNNDQSPVYPASYDLPNIISVAASDQNDRRAAFSNFGPASVDVAAPGVYILSTVPPELLVALCTGSEFTGYDFCDGTSMAAAHVSGLAGLLWNYYTPYDHYQIKWMILRYVDFPNPFSGYILTGGRINAYKSLSALLTPENLAATPLSTSAISLAWLDKATGEDGYKVERMTGGGSFTEITTLPENSVNYSDSGLVDGTTYFYRVRAFNTIPAESFNSEEASATTFLNPPTNLSATKLSGSDVGLAWTDNSKTEDGYIIERRPFVGGYKEITTVGPGVTNYNDSGLAKKRYTYRVRAFNAAAGNSAYSNEASVSLAGHDGGGGCSIGGQQNMPDALADILVMLVPFIFIAIMKRRRRV